jgi:Xaa-Pro dipeptidase
MHIQDIQKMLHDTGINAWLLTDYQQTNAPALKFLAFDPEQHSTRRWFYLIPDRGNPVSLVHSVESGILDHLPGETQTYFGRDALIERLRHIVPAGSRIAMEYSPMGCLPNVSRVDAGTVELVRSLGAEIVSSGDLLQWFSCRWDQAALESHRNAAAVLRNTVTFVWKLVMDQLGSEDLTEYKVQKTMLKYLKSKGCITGHPPIVAAGDHSADPHFSLTTVNSRVIRNNQLLLIDLWCKNNAPGSVYADITWTAWTGPAEPDPFVAEIFEIVRDARDATVQAVCNAFESRIPVTGADLDRIARQHITGKGYGDRFVHRTGHSLDTDVHGAGANLDSLESEDDRRILPGTGFTIEPGIYLPDRFGIRSELNVAVLPGGEVEITGQPVQKSLVRLTA